MAQVDTGNNPNDPNNPNNPQNPANQAPQGQTNQPATSGGAGAVTATGAGNVTGQVVGTANPSQPFQNIASYLAANEPASQQLASTIAGNVSQPIAQANTDITNAANTFTGAVNAGYTPENNPLISAVAQNPSAVVAENPQNVSNFTANLNDTYTGPSDFTQSPGYSNLETEIANAQGAAANTQTPTGVQTLLQGVEGPTTAGINNLDTLLLYNNPENLQTIQNAGTGASALTPNLTNTTAAENALAGTGATNASTAASDAAAALQSALTGETGNLTNEQSTIQGIVNEYNNSVGVINPVTQTIAQDIQNFLAANPNLTLSDATSALAPLENLQTIAMPSESTYASPYDYQTIAALAQLGLNPSALSGLPITSATSNEAQTFNIPTQLQNAVGQAPGVESALNTELNTLGGEINTDVSGFETAQNTSNQDISQAMKILGTTDPNAVGQFHNQTQTLFDPTTGDAVPPTIPQSATDPRTGQTTTTQVPNPAWQALSDQVKQLNLGAQQAQTTMGQLAPSLQWVNTAAPDYNDLVSNINAELGKLGSVGVPTLTYQPTTLTDPVTGAPIGAVGKDIGNAAGIATGAGTAAAGTAAGLSAAEEAAAGVPGEFGEGLATSGAPGAETAAEIGQGVTSGLETVAPAALAAYGTSNIIQNTLKNPVEAGLMDVGNLGLSLGTLSLPPQIFTSIGKDIKNVMNDIGNFFGGLF